MEDQVHNLIRFEEHCGNIRILHFVSRVRNFLELVEEMNQFKKETLGWAGTIRIYILGHGKLVGRGEVGLGPFKGRAMFQLGEEDIWVNNILQYFDLLSSFQSLNSKPEVILGFCYGHLCDPHLFPNIDIHPVTNCQQYKTAITFETDLNGKMRRDSILHLQLAAFIARNLRKTIQTVHTAITR